MLRLNNLTKTFYKGTSNEKTALKNLNLHIEEGDFITVIGGNGAGKSTLLSCIAGVLSPEYGDILLHGESLSGLKEHKRAALLGRVFQDPLLGTAPQMTVEENLILAAKRGKKRGLRLALHSSDKAWLRDAVAQLGLGLEDRMKTNVGLLSGGQRQALTLLMATLEQPTLLLLDEHTAALDPKTAQAVLDLTQKLVQDKKITTLMITHNMNDAIAYGNRLIMMQEGKIVYDATGREKKNLTSATLIEKFYNQGGEANDRMLLA